MHDQSYPFHWQRVNDETIHEFRPRQRRWIDLQQKEAGVAGNSNRTMINKFLDEILALSYALLGVGHFGLLS